MATDAQDDVTRARSFSLADIKGICDSLDALQGELGGLLKELEAAKFPGALTIDGGKRLYDLLETGANIAIKLRGAYLSGRMAKVPEKDASDAPKKSRKK